MLKNACIKVFEEVEELIFGHRNGAQFLWNLDTLFGPSSSEYEITSNDFIYCVLLKWWIFLCLCNKLRIPGT
jgi:hypothetical protein